MKKRRWKYIRRLEGKEDRKTEGKRRKGGRVEKRNEQRKERDKKQNVGLTAIYMSI
jgi:hypothetical protein